MKTNEEIKDIVKQKYSEIAQQGKSQNISSCCGSGPCSTEVYQIMSENYEDMPGYHLDADLGLGCGLPTEFSDIKAGDTVLDLGSGAGNDVFIARSLTGASGKVIGVDFTEAMILKARQNAETLKYNNVEFRLGDIENLPVSDNSVDVIVSNCVLNLVPDKKQAISEIYRVLKPGGHFSISDIVLTGVLPEALQNAAEMYAGCVSGAIQKDEYLEIIRSYGFKNIRIQKEKAIVIPTAILINYLSAEQAESYTQNANKLFSITVYAEKDGLCCTGQGCC